MMRVAILSESSADEAALRILVDAVLGVSTAPIEMALRSRGWPAVRSVLPAIIRALHYRSDAEGLVVVVDSNHTSLSAPETKSRMRELQAISTKIQNELSPVSGRVPLRIAIGVAAPAIEAWLLCKQFSEISEANWEKGIAQKRDPYSKLELKKRLYGVDYASLELMTEKMVQAAHSLKTELPLLKQQFQIGFGGLAQQLIEWRRVGA